MDAKTAGAALSAKDFCKMKCETSLKLNADRVRHFQKRIRELSLNPTDAVIVVINADDRFGSILADRLMPGFNWQEIREKGQIPFARGIALREGIQEALAAYDEDAAAKLQTMEEIAIVVIDHGVAEIFPALTDEIA